MTMRVNGGIINDQMISGKLRFFKMTGPFAWTTSNGTVNLPLVTRGGDPLQTTYFVVGEDQPVPNSAAELAFREITKQCTVLQISLVPGQYGATTAIHFICDATAFGWGSNTPPYDQPPANADEDPAAAAPAMQTAVRSLGNQTVYVSVGGATNPAAAPVTATANMNTVTITEVPFILD